ncbi:ATP-dependent endonuclease [Lysinibacillus sp. RC79]|uniref:ATP-dependent nuclease n=1 Tax=Lysinibacillus sp. RC79 TaxID=3156296 RepID=UPI003516A3FB
MSFIRVNEIQVKNYRSFGECQLITFPNADYKKPIAIVGYNNAGKTNLLNAILIGLTEKYINKETFNLDDFHNRNYENVISITSTLQSSEEQKTNSGTANLSGDHRLIMTLDDSEIINAKIESTFPDGSYNQTAAGAIKYYKVFYVNFHEIKKEISTKKTSWGNLTSFLAKFIKQTVISDNTMSDKKEIFNSKMKDLTDDVLDSSKLLDFINRIQTNYSYNLRNNNCKIDFCLPDYEDIFLEMIFKIGLNGDSENLIPIDHFGDGYISMFVMAVIQAIAESNDEDRCVFLFEEPESFLHENHQEYFYKMILCSLAEKGHQVIYTTHSQKMIDIFDTKGIIRLEFDDEKKQSKVTFNKYNLEFENIMGEKPYQLDKIHDFNNYIKIIEPNLNRIIFSKKVLLVEGPNDLLVYKELIKKRVCEKANNEKYADTYLNFNNIAIIPHHGKITALVLVELCKHLGVEYFIVNDFDLPKELLEKLDFESLDQLHSSIFYKEEIDSINCIGSKGEPLSTKTKRSMLTTNFNLIQAAGKSKIHFNVPRLEEVIKYDSNDKNSFKIWETIRSADFKDDGLFSENLLSFLEID